MCSLRCSICLESAKDRHDETGWAALSCGHVFHNHCVHQCLEHKKACPNCRKSIKSAKGMQSLFLDLVPAMPVTPLGKTQPGGDSGVSEEAAAAMAETLAKRDAELKQHLLELQQTRESLQEQAKAAADQEAEWQAVHSELLGVQKGMEDELTQKRKQVLHLKQSIDKQSSTHKLKCDKLTGQVSRLQAEFDRLCLRNDLGLTKPELEQIAKRMPPPAAKGNEKVNFWVASVDARNRDYAQLMRKFQVETNLHDASKRSLSEQLQIKQTLQDPHKLSMSCLNAAFQQHQQRKCCCATLQDQVAQVKHQLKDMQHRAEEQAQHISMLRTQQSQQAELLSAAPTTVQPVSLREEQKLQQTHPVLVPAASSVIRWDATEDQMLGLGNMQPHDTMHPPSGRHTVAQLPLQRHVSAMHNSSSVQPPARTPPAGCALHTQSVLPAPREEAELNAVQQAGDAATQSDRDDKAQANDADLTQEDLPDMSLFHSSAHSTPMSFASGAQQQTSNSQQSLRAAHDRLSPRVQLHDTGQAAAGTTDKEAVHCHVVADAAENGPPQDESLDDLLEYLADAAAADELHTNGDTALAQPGVSTHNGSGPSSSSKSAEHCHKAATMSCQQPAGGTKASSTGGRGSDAMLSIELDSPGDSRIAEVGTRMNETKASMQDDKHARMMEAVRAVALGKSAKLASAQTAAAGLSGIQRHAMHEPSFVNSSAGFRSKGQMAGDFIVKGADGRGGRTTVLRPSNKPAQAVPSFIASGMSTGSKLPAKRKAAHSGAENLKIKHFFAPSSS